MLSAKLDFSAALAQINALASSIEEATRPAAHAGAKVLYAEVETQVKSKPAGHTKDLPRDVSGNLLKSVYRAFAEQESFPQQSKSPGYGTATYRIGYNHGVAPHGWWIENGHLQYYVVRLHDDGYWYTLKRPDAPPGPPPNPRDGRAAMDAYYVRREGGPKWIKPYPFLRPAWDAKVNEALIACRDRFFEYVRERTASSKP